MLGGPGQLLPGLDNLGQVSRKASPQASPKLPPIGPSLQKSRGSIYLAIMVKFGSERAGKPTPALDGHLVHLQPTCHRPQLYR